MTESQNFSVTVLSSIPWISTVPPHSVGSRIQLDGREFLFIMRNRYLVFNLFLAHSPETLEFSSDKSSKNVSCNADEMTFRLHLRMGAGYQENQPCD